MAKSEKAGEVTSTHLFRFFTPVFYCSFTI